MASKGATLELAVLGLLHDSPLHGYELRKRLNLLLGWTRLLSYGSLYPALKRMLRAGLVTEVATARRGSRDGSGSSTRSPRRAPSTSPARSPTSAPRPGRTRTST